MTRGFARGYSPLEWEPRRALFAETAQDGTQLVPRRRWRNLFDGQTLNGWAVVGDRPENWVVENGAIHCRGNGGGYLRTIDQFGNFALACEFNVSPRANSGIFVRWSDLRDPVNTGIEVQVMDTAGKREMSKHDSGALYDLVAPSVDAMHPAGQWNWMVITCSGPYIGVKLNGRRVAEMDLDQYTTAGRSPDGTENKFKYPMAKLPRRGYIGLQNHGNEVWYRNLMLLPINF